MEEIKQPVPSPEVLSPERKKTFPLVLAVLTLLLAAAYVGLCVWVSLGSTILPNVRVGETVVGGMTVAQAARAIEEETDARFAPCQVRVNFGGKGDLLVSGDVVAADGHTAALEAYQAGRKDSFFLFGARYLAALFRSTELELPICYDPDSPALDDRLKEAFGEYESEMIPSVYTVETDGILVCKGTPGVQCDREDAAEKILQALVDAAGTGEEVSLALEPVTMEPASIDWQALADQVFVSPADAALDTENGEIVPSVTGVSLNTVEAKHLYDRAEYGESFTVPLTFTQPEITTDLLFRDTLGEVKTSISGVANRVSNVALAAELCNNILLMPGDVFSYWDTVGPCSASQGFLPAPSYVNGATVDSVGGGICQVSSSIYYAALKADLEIVERQNHSYAVGYVPDGADATVYGGNPDFRFKNSTDYPIRIVAYAQGRNLTVRLEGTKTDDTYVKMEFRELSRTQPETIYKADESVPAGTTKVSVTSYTGRKVEAYRCVYSGDGTLLSRTLESVNNYKKRDKVVLCNPAELYLYDPTVPAPTPSVEPTTTPAPTDSADPGATVSPSESPAPSETPAPEESQESGEGAQSTSSAPPASPPPAGETESAEAETEE